MIFQFQVTKLINKHTLYRKNIESAFNVKTYRSDRIEKEIAVNYSESSGLFLILNMQREGI